ncbi:hypothetical protein G9C85_03905 [Halorubellus sp. JP-L1]|uniref:hypothetical protein n=1 Tax=Halorubellus sp. JP-L1 TaxID=2715753 RepID=UPI00140BA8A2|nr:hypothetical protein [Halorubellus sp. JP-L1]NHN40780.1 hypothetical protein [Halorubellus sp. JP-L1]
MSSGDLATRVEDALAVDQDAFQSRVREDAEVIKAELHDGTFDNPQAIVGFEYEFYAVDDETTALRRVPRRLLEFIGFEKELGLHNAEMSTSPQPFNAHGLRAQESEVLARLQTAQDCASAEGMRLVSDGMWTIPPEGETATGYLTDSVDDGGVRVATNMSDSARYHAMANRDAADAIAGMRLDAPHVNLDADTVMPESLITSIQPHYQVPHAEDLPTYFRYALRIAGPLLAVGVNSPFFPPDLYDDGVDAETLLADAWMEHRIGVFETVLNAETGTTGKVRFPRDFDDVDTAVDRIAADDTLVPMPVESSNRFDDRFAAFRMKHGTYWRWVRPVFGGPTRSSANARIEFRPIAGQPTVRDAIAFQAVFAGLMEALPKLEHPVADLDWEVARDNFYSAMREGLAADLVWITNDGQTVRNTGRMYEDLLAYAEEGLQMRGLDEDEAARYTHPLKARVRRRMTPARWKHERVAATVDDGASFEDAVYDAQRSYVDAQRKTLLDSSFAEWLQDGRQ